MNIAILDDYQDTIRTLAYAGGKPTNVMNREVLQQSPRPA